MLRDQLNSSNCKISYTYTANESISGLYMYDMLKNKSKEFYSKKYKTLTEVAKYLHSYGIIGSSAKEYLSALNAKFELTINGKLIEPFKINEEGFYYIDFEVFYDALNIKEIAEEVVELELVSL